MIAQTILSEAVLVDGSTPTKSVLTGDTELSVAEFAAVFDEMDVSVGTPVTTSAGSVSAPPRSENSDSIVDVSPRRMGDPVPSFDAAPSRKNSSEPLAKLLRDYVEWDGSISASKQSVKPGQQAEILQPVRRELPGTMPKSDLGPVTSKGELYTRNVQNQKGDGDWVAKDPEQLQSRTVRIDPTVAQTAYPATSSDRLIKKASALPDTQNLAQDTLDRDQPRIIKTEALPRKTADVPREAIPAVESRTQQKVGVAPGSSTALALQRDEVGPPARAMQEPTASQRAVDTVDMMKVEPDAEILVSVRKTSAKPLNEPEPRFAPPAKYPEIVSKNWNIDESKRIEVVDKRPEREFHLDVPRQNKQLSPVEGLPITDREGANSSVGIDRVVGGKPDEPIAPKWTFQSTPGPRETPAAPRGSAAPQNQLQDTVSPGKPASAVWLSETLVMGTENTVSVNLDSDLLVSEGSTKRIGALGSLGAEPLVARSDVPKAITAQMAEAVRSNANGSFEVKLSPEELGRVKLSLSPTEAGLTVTILAERPETMDLIRRNLEIFAQDLRQQGHQSIHFQFGSNENSSQQSYVTESLDEESSVTEEHRLVDVPTTPKMMTVDGRLDLRL